MHDFWTPPLLARAAPDAKLLIMFRDPIERFRSGVPHRLGQRPDHRLEAVTADAIERGKYATQLRRVLACHDAAKLLILQYEKCVADPAGQYRRTLGFLGADPDHVHDGFARQRGTTQAAKKKPLWDDLMAGLRADAGARGRRARGAGAGDRRLPVAQLRPPGGGRMRSPLERLRPGGEPGPPDFIGVGALGAGHGVVARHAARSTRRSGRRTRAAARCTTSTASARPRWARRTSRPTTHGSPAGPARSAASGPGATCSTPGRRRCSGAPRRTRSCWSCSPTRSSATGRSSPSGWPGAARTRRSTWPTSSTAAATAPSSRGCTASSTPRRSSCSSSSAAGATRRPVPAHARLPRRARPRLRPAAAAAQGGRQARVARTWPRCCALGLPEGTQRRVTERLTRPAGLARAGAAVARARGGPAHRAGPGRDRAARARAGARPRAVAELRPPRRRAGRAHPVAGHRSGRSARSAAIMPCRVSAAMLPDTSRVMTDSASSSARRWPRCPTASARRSS